MDWIWEKTLEFWCSFFRDEEAIASAEDSAPPTASSSGSQSSKTMSRVRFSRSTIGKFPLNELEHLGSTNAFFNFLLAQRIRQVGLVGLNYLDVVNSHKSIPEKQIWDLMDDKQRSPYLKLAKNILQQHRGTFQDKKKQEEMGYQNRRGIIAASKIAENPNRT